MQSGARVNGERDGENVRGARLARGLATGALLKPETPENATL